MLIHISPEEFEEGMSEPWKSELIKSPSIDYATNCVHGWFEGNDVIVFRFKPYGFINDNRYNSYEISYGSAGITINITKYNG
jgi:hypothetical protein